MKDGAQPGFEVEVCRLECGVDARGVFVAYGVVIFLDDRFLAGEVVVGGSEGDLGLLSDVAHGGGFEAAFAEEGKGGVEDLGAGFGGVSAGKLRIEHVQIMREWSQFVKGYLNMFIKMNNAFIISLLGGTDLLSFHWRSHRPWVRPPTERGAFRLLFPGRRLPRRFSESNCANDVLFRRPELPPYSAFDSEDITNRAVLCGALSGCFKRSVLVQAAAVRPAIGPACFIVGTRPGNASHKASII